jgi:site-specific DNA-methyltransferase (adenine-specific)
MPLSEVFNIDCMELLRQTPDKYYSLSIVDPPYGGGQHFNFRFGTDVYESKPPSPEYWVELLMVSKDQIVWGGNYFTEHLPMNRCWISWFKGNPAPNFSDIELAWTSFDRVSKQISIESYGFNHADRKNGEKTIHPTQKPVSLYKWLLKNYAKEGDKILDTHLGSGSSRIAAYDMGFDFTAFEIDKDYFKAQEERFQNHIKQLKIFSPVPQVKDNDNSQLSLI